MGQPSGGGYVSIRRNAESTSAKFGYDKSTGYFGDKHPRSKPKTREIISNSPAKDARELFRQITKGGVKEEIKLVNHILTLDLDVGEGVFVIPY